MIGKTLGHYQLTNQLGKGGMGEVFQAKDQRLGRNVAIKVLPEEFARDTDRVARFQREAKLLASLNHPNIAAIHGLEESDGTNFLVLELVEGETLADMLKRGPIPVEEALKLALQIAEALEAAHEKGVIHRDLKPANIKVTPDGKVKVLDFGLAKAFAGEQEELNLANSPTLSDAATQQGVILGTAAYMSPEQAKGKIVDKRADIWAFGVVLFEMLIGRQLFSGETVSETLAAVLMKDPDFSLLPPNLHPRIREMLTRCLEKDPKNRYSGISDARVDLQKVLAGSGDVFVPPFAVEEPREKSRRTLLWASITVILVIIAGTIVWKLRTPAPPKVMRFDFEVPAERRFGDLRLTHLAVSPDGGRIVYATIEGLFLRTIDELDTRLISGTKNSAEPFFSPDGKWIGFYDIADRQLKKIPVSGGAPVVLCNAETTLGAGWYADGTIIYSDMAAGILRVSANGGAPELLVKQEELFLASPQLLPGGKTLLFGHVKSDMKCDIVVQSLESGERKILFPGATPRYLPTGHIVYGVENNLFAVPFDAETLKTTGSPVSVIQGVFRVGPGNVPHYAASDGGTLVYMPGGIGLAYQSVLVWADRDGKEKPLEEVPNDYSDPKISPDGTQVALSMTVDGNRDIYIYDLVRGTKTRWTFDEASDFLPIWTPDGKRIIFGSERAERQSIFGKASDGTGKVEQIASVPKGWMWPISLSNDGNTLLFGQYVDASSGSYNIGMLSMQEDHHTPKLLLQEKYDEQDPMVSPDGRWLAYRSNESGRFDVFVRPFPEVNAGGKWQVSTDGGMDPLWSPDGKELFYRSGNAVMAVSVETSPSFRLGTPKKLFEGSYSGWDIRPDGRRFLLVKEAESTGKGFTQRGPRKINIVLNWTEELKQRVPVP
jgi:serine/threonine protein kinase/Tol biopolymer transport system component